MKGYCFSLFLVSSLLVGCNKAEVNTTAATTAVQPLEITLEEATAPKAQMRVLADASAEVEQAPAPANPQTSPNLQNKKIIRSGNIAVESKAISKSKSAIDASLAQYGGYYEQETLSSTGSYATYNLVVRIPVAQLDSFLKGLEKGGDKLTERAIRSDDVSLQYFDSESRLQSKRAYLARYQQLVSQAESVKDLLAIQEQIRQLQEDIDSQESIMRSLKDQIAYSTLTIQLFEYQANLPIGSQSFWIQLKDALADGWASIGEVALFVLRLWPLLLVIIFVVLAWRKFRKR